jgi:hypothetical protein
MFKHFAIFAVAVTCVTFYAEAKVMINAGEAAHTAAADREATDTLGEASGYDVPNTNQHGGGITIANPTLCNDFVQSTTNRMAKCTFANGPHADCTQASNLPSGFYDYTDQASVVACGFTMWNDAIKGYSKWPLWKWGHTADIIFKGREANWDGVLNPSGNYLVFTIKGKYNGNAEECELEAGVKILLCNSKDANGNCNCADSALIKMEQGAKIVKPSGRSDADNKAKCGLWFLGASTMFNMMVAHLRQGGLASNPVTKSCTTGG